MRITILEEFRNNFNSYLDTVPEANKPNLIINEIKEIQNFIKFDQNKYQRNKLDKYNLLSPKPFHIFEISIHSSYRVSFNKAFNDYNILGKIEVLADIENSNIRDVTIQAYEFVKYYDFLNDLIIERSSKTQQKKSGLSHKQKMLALHYLGLDLSKFENTNSAKILSQILDLDYDNTRKYLSYLATGKNEVRTKKNLETLVNIFDVQGFENITNTIKKDIEKF